jgi:hypothetical protein
MDGIVSTIIDSKKDEEIAHYMQAVDFVPLD